MKKISPSLFDLDESPNASVEKINTLVKEILQDYKEKISKEPSEKIKEDNRGK